MIAAIVLNGNITTISQWESASKTQHMQVF